LDRNNDLQVYKNISTASFDREKNERTTAGLAIGWLTEEQSATTQYQQ